MLCLQAFSENNHQENKDSVNNYYVYTDFFQNRNRNLALLTHSFNSDYRLKEINQIILNELLKNDWKETSIESQLKDVFQKLNWQLSNLFKKIAFKTAENLSEKNKNIFSKVNEKGLSLCFMMSFGNRIYFVQFGRMLCGVVRSNSEEDIFTQIGEKWDNARVKSQEELHLLGAESIDIKIPVHKVELTDADMFAILFSGATEKLLAKGIHPRTIEENLNEIYLTNPYPYCLFSVPAKYEKGKSFIKMKAQTIGTIIITALLISSVFYNLFGNREVENQLSILKTLIQENIRNTDIEDISLNVTAKMKELNPKFNKEQVEEFIQDYLSKMTQPAKEIIVENTDSIISDKNISSIPLFDTKLLYVCSGNILTAYGRKNFNKKWVFVADMNILHTDLVDGNRILASGKTVEVCINRKTGEEIWRKSVAYNPVDKSKRTVFPIQISFFEEKRLKNSVLLRLSGKNLEFVSSVDGAVISTYVFKDNIEMISEYDHVKKCLYAINGNTITELSIKIKN